MRKESMDSYFKLGFSGNKFETDYSYGGNKINIKFKYYNDKITICEVSDPQACEIYTQFASLNIFSKNICSTFAMGISSYILISSSITPFSFSSSVSLKIEF